MSQPLTPVEQQTIDSYGLIGQEYIANNRNFNFWEKAMGRFEELLPGGIILEIGCAGGNDARHLIDFGYEYIGVDVTPLFITEAKKEVPDGDFRLQSVYDLDFPDNHFDGFWCSATLLHIPKVRIDQALQSIRRVVKVGGIGFIAMKKGEGERMEESLRFTEKKAQRFFNYYHLIEFANVLEKNNFEVFQCFERELKDVTWLVYFVKRRS